MAGELIIDFKHWEFDLASKSVVLSGEVADEWKLYNNWLETDGLQFIDASPRDRLKAYEASIKI